MARKKKPSRETLEFVEELRKKPMRGYVVLSNGLVRGYNPRILGEATEQDSDLVKSTQDTDYIDNDTYIDYSSEFPEFDLDEVGSDY
jgi:hypothetical protein